MTLTTTVTVSRSCLHLTANLPSAEILRYNLTSDAWSEVGTMENGRRDHAVAVVEDVAAFCGDSARMAVNTSRPNIAVRLYLVFVLCINLVMI